MNFNYFFHKAIPQIENLRCIGFEKIDNEFTLRRNLENKDFYVVFHLIKDSLTADVYEHETNEKYVLVDVPSAQGAFVGNLREGVEKIALEIFKEGFRSIELKDDFNDFVKTSYGVTPDFPWDDSPDAAVYRCPNGKWFALVMHIKFRQLGIPSDEYVWVVNLKSDCAEKITDKKSVFPAYHMNKKYWITVLLTSVTDFQKLCDYIQTSYNLVYKKK